MRVLMPAILSCVVLICIFTSCRRYGGCDEPQSVYNSGIVAVFKDSATSKYLYEEISPLYNKDSLKVFDSLGNSLSVQYFLYPAPGNSSLQIYLISFGSIANPNTDASSFTSEVNKDFIIQYKYNERDTIRAIFRSRESKCGSVFESLGIYHKGQLLTTVSNQAYVNVTISKY